MKNFASNETTARKWVLNRPFQAQFAEAMIELSGLSRTATSSKKCLRPSEIQKSEEMVRKIVTTLTTQFLNPFQDDLESDKLYNLVSGRPVRDAICSSLTTLELLLLLLILLSYHIISYHIISYHIISYHIISYHISYHIISYIISYHIIYHISYIIYRISYIIYHISYIISYHIISYHIISYHIISYHIISYHIISYHIIYIIC